MDRGRDITGCWCCLVLLTLLLIQEAKSSIEESRGCAPSRCGEITKIRYPFRLRDDPAKCGDPTYELACENNVTLLHLYSGTYRVLRINYNNSTIRLVDPGIQEGDCSSLPRYFLYQSNFTDTFNYSFRYDPDPYLASLWPDSKPIFEHVVYLNCSDPVRDDPEYVDTSPCVNWESKGKAYIYALVGDLVVDKLKSQCGVKLVATITSNWSSFLQGESLSYAEIHRVLSYGFEVYWWKRAFKPGIQNVQRYQGQHYCATPMGLMYYTDCRKLAKLRIFAEDYLYGIYKGLHQIVREGTDHHYNDSDFSLTQRAIVLGEITGRCVLPYIAARLLFGISFLLALLIYTCRRRHLSMYENIEEFLQLHNLIPIRYSYKELKTMTKGFKNKLGEGGFGTVYKGKLSSGPFVAIKMLGKSKGNGQEFINEVATIGRIHHFNVVHLVGFCVEGTKRALVYEFMPNGSLDRYIFSKEESVPLSYEKIFEISFGVARGIAYLHHGCEVKILHFDIKPHNILLDDNFAPKVSDFGLARLYPVDDSIVTLTAARGTIGYMAPELFYKNIGGVSYKADVYSFGMLLMEMASRRRNLNPNVEHSSQLYFPLWIYDQFNEEKDIEMEDLTKEEKDLAKKMLIVALWCIQLKPTDRPSMNKVLEMLEVNNVESLEMPPKPSLYPSETVLIDDISNFDEITTTNSIHSPSSLGEVACDGVAIAKND